MDTQVLQLTEQLKIVNKGHILYLYESLQDYVENAVAYGISGMEYGHQVFFIEDREIFAMIKRQLQQRLNIDSLPGHIHHVDNQEFYSTHGDFNYVTIVRYFESMLQPFLLHNTALRTWAHVEWREQDNITEKLEEFEAIADDSVSDLDVMSLCAYNANTLPASFVSRMLRSHGMYMTDEELVKSPLYRVRESHT
ncbi:MEDS domain-containing protein [Alicyclobacillus ferrooxydans]|uniref:MEDS domain-containing protein n=1 Tax=Alicyclobacillus ferrooxydans TaxID=471514 RepID=A0A0P9CDV9_9BACL|nr:MEDS domain-containing protein [Alicyclobacillus ferrooxydans]KPV43783.1 hypothetical protein AN477_10370 [Alicyclobacillus ferrooxydans]